MPHLLERIRAFRHQRRTRPGRRAPAGPGRRYLWLWIVLGLAVVLGGYFWRTSARLLKEPLRLEYGPSDPAFPAAMGPIVSAEFMGGNRIDTYVNGDAFFPVMLDAIRHAKHTITLESYIWSSGAVSNQFIAALSARARAGVKVHVLVDGMGSLKFNRGERDQLRAAGVELHVYGRDHWYEIKPNINHRTHRKLLIIDGKIGFTGGMCIDDRWMGNGDHPEVWRETQVRVEGPAVREMQAVFATNWMQTTSSLLLGEDYFPEMVKIGDSLAQCYKSGPGEAAEAARLGYLFAIASARKSIDISQAYFVPDDLAIEMLLEALARGVKVRIIVPAINDSRFGRAASRSRWGQLLEAGAEFYLFEPAMYHCKTMVVDAVFVTVGSANFDNRSFSLNDEVSLDVLDREVASQHLKIFARDLSHSRRLTREEFEGRPFYIKIADHLCGMFRSQF